MAPYPALGIRYSALITSFLSHWWASRRYIRQTVFGRRSPLSAPCSSVASRPASGLVLPATEIIIGLSLLVLGYLVLTGCALSMPVALAAFAGFGLFHGAAFGGSIAAQEADVGGGVLIGYLLGLGVVQYAISAASGWIAWNVWKATEAAAIQARLAGAVVAGVGLFLSMENAEGIVFEVMGWSS